MEYIISGVNIEDIHQVQLELMKEVDEICRKHGIVYQLFSGTLLGAVRHKGFIPWDDDLDICMLREDYERFIKICETELDEKYFFQRPDTDKNYLLQFGKIRKNGTLFVEGSFASEDIHHGVYIDVFPLDDIRPNTFTGSLQEKIFFLLNRLNLVRSKSIANASNNMLSKIVRNMMRYLMVLFPRKAMNYLLKKTATSMSSKEAIYVADVTSGNAPEVFNSYVFDKSTFTNVKEFEFEGCYFLGPKEYDTILRLNFGDYMTPPPLEEQIGHHNIIEIIL